MSRKCIVYTNSLKDEVKYNGTFHGFFQYGYGEEDGYADFYPVALVENEEGSVKEVMIQYFSFVKPEENFVFLTNLPRYEARSNDILN